jgi:hypothetical protein
MYWYDSISRNTNLEKHHKPNLNFWKTKPYVKNTLNEHLCLLSKGSSYWVNHSSELLNSRFSTQKHQAAKLLPTWHLKDILPMFKLLNAITALTHPYSFPSYVIYNQRIYLQEGCSGLEFQSPVNFITRIWNFCYKPLPHQLYKGPALGHNQYDITCENVAWKLSWLLTGIKLGESKIVCPCGMFASHRQVFTTVQGVTWLLAIGKSAVGST